MTAEETPVEGVEASEDELARLEQQLAGLDDEAPAATGSPPEDDEEGIDEAPIDVGAADAPVEEVEEEEEEEDEDGVEVEEHLRDSVDGSLRLKRLLSRDDDDTPGAKKRKKDAKSPEENAKIKTLLLKWGLALDMSVKHVLDQLSKLELEELIKSGYAVDKFNQWKSPAELLAKYCNELRERKMVGGSPVDCISAFKSKYKFDIMAEKKIRALGHKELRYVLNNFTGDRPLDEIIEEAKEDVPEENTALTSLPEHPGVSTMGRFTRLELIDPLADAAVFGDANLTFAVALARHRKALGHVGRVIATTFEELEVLRERYKEIDETIKILEDHFAEVYHGVDCTRIAIDPRFKEMEGSLGAVYYNFPHSGAIQGFFDGHPIVNWRHENLMRLFFRALRSFMKVGGTVKVASNMGAIGVRYSYIIGGALENEFKHTETMPFLEWHLHRYGRSYGDKRDVYKRPDAKNNQSYNAQRAEADMVYCFEYAPSGEPIGQQAVRLPPTLKVLKACNDGPFRSLQGPAKVNLANQLYKRFVTEVSGTHVG